MSALDLKHVKEVYLQQLSQRYWYSDGAVKTPPSVEVCVQNDNLFGELIDSSRPAFNHMLNSQYCSFTAISVLHKKTDMRKLTRKLKSLIITRHVFSLF